METFCAKISIEAMIYVFLFYVYFHEHTHDNTDISTIFLIHVYCNKSEKVPTVKNSIKIDDFKFATSLLVQRAPVFVVVQIQ